MTATESPTLVDQPRIPPLPPLPPGYEFAGFGVEVEKTYGRSLDAGTPEAAAARVQRPSAGPSRSAPGP